MNHGTHFVDNGEVRGANYHEQLRKTYVNSSIPFWGQAQSYMDRFEEDRKTVPGMKGKAPGMGGRGWPAVPAGQAVRATLGECGKHKSLQTDSCNPEGGYREDLSVEWQTSKSQLVQVMSGTCFWSRLPYPVVRVSTRGSSHWTSSLFLGVWYSPRWHWHVQIELDILGGKKGSY